MLSSISYDWMVHWVLAFLGDSMYIVGSGIQESIECAGKYIAPFKKQ